MTEILQRGIGAHCLLQINPSALNYDAAPENAPQATTDFLIDETRSDPYAFAAPAAPVGAKFLTLASLMSAP